MVKINLLISFFQIIQLPGDSACSCFDTDEEVAFFGCEDGVIHILDVETGQQVLLAINFFSSLQIDMIFFIFLGSYTH